MRTWTLRLGLSLLAALGFITSRLPAQTMVAPAQQVFVVPALRYEPDHPPPSRSAAIVPVDFTQPGDVPPTAPLVDPLACCKPDPARFWARTEYLLWRVKDAPVPLPLISANNNPASIAALNEAGTMILFGAGSGQSTDFGWLSGMRLAVGAWVDAEMNFGWEANAFFLARGALSSRAGSADGTGPVIAIPINATVPFNGNPAGETSLNATGVPANFPNQVAAVLTSRLWGAEANAVVNLLSSNRFHLTGLVGFRYLDLLENLTLSETAFDPTIANASQTAVDGFGARNQFYAGQLGLRGDVTRGYWTLEATAKVALGSMHEVVNIAGATTVVNGAFGSANGTTPGGLFGEPSNIGHTNRNVFAVAPEVTVQLAYEWTSWLRSFVGYNFLYMSNVLRPGNQMDRNINPTQNSFLVPPGTLVGAPAPLPIFRASDFWAQGVNFGVELRY